MCIRYCLQCDDGTELKYERKDIHVIKDGQIHVLKDIKGWHCTKCKECEFVDEEDSNIHMNFLNSIEY